MANLIELDDDGGDIPECECDSCNVVFGIFWRRDGFTDRVNFCPFCGEEVDE